MQGKKKTTDREIRHLENEIEVWFFESIQKNQWEAFPGKQDKDCEVRQGFANKPTDLPWGEKKLLQEEKRSIVSL